MVHLVVTRPEELALAAGELHDWFCDLDDVRLEADCRQLVVPFRRWETAEATIVRQGRLSRTEELPWYRWYLRIGEVLDHAVDDPDRLGELDFEDLDWDPDRRVLSVLGNMPVTFAVHVAALHVEVEQTREYLGLARRRVGRGGAWDSYSGTIRFPLP